MTTLLLGTECARNHASYITNQMVLDLIIYHNLSWNECEFWFPMSAKGIVPSARMLDRLMSPFLPFPYVYHGPITANHEGAEEIYYRELRTLGKWCGKF